MAIRTPDQRLRVFISSTLQELAEERGAAREAVARLRLSPVMFELGARPHPPGRLYRAYLTQSDVFVGIYWQRYGWIAPGETVSGLEDEYRLSGALPRLIYVKSPAPDREPRLSALLEQIERDGRASYKVFGSAAELGKLIENDLAILLSECFEHPVVERSAPVPDRPLTNLPAPMNPLIGRELELSTACDLLRRDDVGLVTLVGPGGTGKSRLGLQIAIELLDSFDGDSFLVALESVHDPALVMPTIAHTLSVPETRNPARSPIERLIGELRDRRTLLLLDNFEQVVAAAPELSMLLENCPGLKVLVTSRRPLRVRGEKELPVPPLAVPLPRRALDLESLSQYAAVALFIERARAVLPDFTVTNESAPAVAEICHRLDGLPLAIELAAARVKILPPMALLARLERGLDVLRGGTRDLPTRQQTMRDAIGWSYDLLDGNTKVFFGRLSVFADSWSLEAADAICATNGDPPIEFLDEMERLVDGSLLTQSVAADGEPRFGMLETIREYAMERLIESGEVDRVRRRQAEFYLALVQRAEPRLRTSDQVRWADHLEVEHQNIRAVLAWSREHDVELGLRLCGSIWRFWEMRNFIGEGRAWLEAFLGSSDREARGRVNALHGAAAMAAYQGDYEVARRYTKQALSISRRRGDRRGTATALNELALVATYRGDFDTARRLLDRSLTIKRELGDQWLIANSLVNLGLVAGYQRDYQVAYEIHRESLALYRELDDTVGVATATGNLGYVAMKLGRLEEAQAHQAESLQLFHHVGDTDGLAESLERLAMLALAESDPIRAAELFGAACALREDVDILLLPAELSERESAIDAVRAGLGAADFEAAWRAGTGMSRDEALAAALGRLSSQPEPHSGAGTV